MLYIRQKLYKMPVRYYISRPCRKILNKKHTEYNVGKKDNYN